MTQWGRQRQVHLLLRLLGLTIVLSAIVTLPVCPADGFSPVTDADARTITEQRSITEVVTTPGVHVLHVNHGLADSCETCVPTEPQPGTPQHLHLDDIGQRSALLPDTFTVDVTPVVLPVMAEDAPALATHASPDAPPPQVFT